MRHDPEVEPADKGKTAEELSGPAIRRKVQSRRQAVLAMTGIAFTLPAMAYFIMWIFVPAGYGMWLSLTNSSFIGSSEFVGLANFRMLFASGTWWNSVVLTLLYMAEVIPLTLLLAFTAAYLINKLKRAGGFFSAIFFLPYVIPSVASSIVFELLMQPGGLINQTLHTSTPWLVSSRYAISAVAIATAWTLFGFYVVIFLAGLQSVPKDVIEASSLDGAGPWKRLWRIELPLLRPMILFTVVTATAYLLTNFTSVYVMTRGGPGDATNILAVNIYRTAFEYTEPGVAEAMAVILLLVSMILTVIEFAWLGRDPRK